MDSHAKIQKRIRPLQRSVSLLKLPPIVLLSIALFFAVYAFSKQDHFIFIYLLPLCVITGALFVVKKMQEDFLKHALRAEQLIRTTRARKMMLTYTGLGDKSGHIMLLHEKSASKDPASEGMRPWAVIRVRSLPWGKIPPKDPLPVHAYALEQSPGSCVTIETRKTIFWGIISTEQSRQKSANSQNFGIGLAFIALVAIFAMFFYTQHTDMNALKEQQAFARKSASWPITQGLVLFMETKDAIVQDGRMEHNAFELVLRYSYTVEGKSYIGQRLRFGYEPTQNENNAHKLATRYAPKTTHPVAYNPDAPEQSVLEPGNEQDILVRTNRIEERNMATAVIGGPVFLVIFSVVAFAIRRQKRLEKKFGL